NATTTNLVWQNATGTNLFVSGSATFNSGLTANATSTLANALIINGVTYNFPSGGTSIGKVLTVTSTGGGINTLTWETASSSAVAITTLNGLTDTVQTFATGTAGTDFNVSSTAAVHTFNIPSASTVARGLVTTVTQSFAGAKTFIDSTFLGSDATDKLTVSSSLASSLIPDITNTYDLGAAGLAFRTLYASTSVIVGSTVTIGSHAIEFSSSTPDFVLANGTGNYFNFRDSAGNTLLQILDSGTTGNINVTGSVASNLIPSADLSFNLGTSAFRWNNLFADHLTITGTSTLADFTFTNATGTTLVATNVSSTNFLGTNATFTNLVANNFSPTNLNVTNATFTNLFATSSNFINQIVTNATTTNLVWQNATGTNLFMAGLSTFNTGLTSNGAFTLTVPTTTINGLTYFWPSASTTPGLLRLDNTGSLTWVATSSLGISGGTGLASLNAVTSSTQTFATGTTGTDFNIVSD
ncbi:MAG: hypothetical protein FD130_1710, partial [Halothiobacillaceae bacterium]